MLLFNGTDGIQRSEPINTDKAYIYIQGDGAGSILEQAFVGCAPATSINISQNIDIDTHKAFDGNYTIGIFGHGLTEIIIDGLDIYSGVSVDGKACISGTDIQTWWNAWNLSDKPGSRISLGICCNGSAATFICVATRLEKTMTPNATNSLVGTYRLTILGVKEG